jgi:methyltransferase
VGVLTGAIVEVWLAEREFVAALGVPMLAVFVAANVLRWWVIASLGTHWNVGIVDSAAIGVVERGPYRWIRHPNYVAVFAEMLALPLVHGAYFTAIAGTVLHVPVLWRRIVAEEAVLLAHEPYRLLMGPKPRFWPGRSR